MKEEDDKRPRVTTHLQVTESERRQMPRGLSERAYYKNRPSYMAPSRTWQNSNADKELRQPKFKFHVPEWLMPKNGVHVWNTLTASIVWGICGKMADMEGSES